MQFPQVRLVGLIAIGRTELIVVVVLDFGGGKVAVERFEILVGSAWPAMEQKYLDLRVVSHPLGPNAKGPLRSAYRDHLYSAAERVIAFRVVEIPLLTLLEHRRCDQR